MSPGFSTRCDSGRSFFANDYNNSVSLVFSAFKSNRKREQRLTISSFLPSLIFFPINLFTHSDLSPSEELIPGTTRGIVESGV